MTTLQTMIQDLCTAGANPQATIQTSLKETGKPAVGCFPLFVPEELIYAAGFLPVGMWGGISAFQKSNQYIQSSPAPSCGPTWSWACPGSTIS